MTSLISPVLAGDWIQRLGRQLVSIRNERAAEITRISDEFQDVEMLAKSYLDPDVQFFNPADFNEDEPGRVLRSPARQWINDFLKGEFAKHDGRHVVFVLSDAGMGKTSLLMMLKLTHLGRFWPDGLDFQLLKLGPETLYQLAAFKNRRRIVLLLDSLDEDPQAWGRIEERLQDLLFASRNFRQVFITCRTQFFPRTPDTGQAAIEQPGKVEVEGYVCNLLYLSPFSDEQVKAYLRKLYATWPSEIWRWATGKESRRVEEAQRVVVPMNSLRMRPMLLAYIQDLMKSEVSTFGEYSVYEALVLEWLRREKRKQSGGPEVVELLSVCQRLALTLYRTQRRSLPEAELEALLEGFPVDFSNLDVGGRSLLNRTSSGDFRFAHYSIREFLVAQKISGDALDLKKGSDRSTDQIGSFMVSLIEDGARPLEERLERAEALGGLGDPRIAPGADSFLPIPGLESVRLGRYPVTVVEYARFVSEGGYEAREYWNEAGWRWRTKDGTQAPEDWEEQLRFQNRPVVGISWFEAIAYCAWRSRQLRKEVRLPRVAEWERAAKPDGRVYPWGREKPTPDLANYGRNIGAPTPVGLFPAGQGVFGHLDLLGNVWEWSADSYSQKAVDKESIVRVLCGGSWLLSSQFLHADYRIELWAGYRYQVFGFRVCVSDPEP